LEYSKRINDNNSIEGSVETIHIMHRTTSQQNQTQQQELSTKNIHQYYSMYGSIIGIIGCSILRILDVGLQIQRHPIPIILGYIPMVLLVGCC
jgi:hypothetical protein